MRHSNENYKCIEQFFDVVVFVFKSFFSNMKYLRLLIAKPTSRNAFYLDSVDDIHNNDLFFRGHWDGSRCLDPRSLSPPPLVPNVSKRGEENNCVIHGDRGK